MASPAVSEFLQLATGPYICAYDAAGAARKVRFARSGKRTLQLLATALGLAKGEYEVRWNPGGIAVCGDLHLYADWVTVFLEPTIAWPPERFMFRSCTSRTDYAGGTNQWLRYEYLNNLDEAAAMIKSRLGRS